MKRSEDDTFVFTFTFITTGYERGFVTHYRPKHPPLSPELASVFRFLDMQKFDQCPEYDFEPCHFRTLLYVSRGDSPFDSNTDHAHRGFDAHASRFSPALRSLLLANSEMEKVGMTYLPLDSAARRMNAAIETNTIRPKVPRVSRVAAMPEQFDVAISFAGTEREHAQQLAEQVRAAGFTVFYDNFYPEQLWGKDLVTFFDEVFRKRARFCVVFVSREYRDRKWTSHEVRSAQARALEEKGNEYILPIRVDETQLDGMLPTLGYVPISMGVEKIGELLIAKLS